MMLVCCCKVVCFLFGCRNSCTTAVVGFLGWHTCDEDLCSVKECWHIQSLLLASRSRVLHFRGGMLDKNETRNTLPINNKESRCSSKHRKQTFPALLFPSFIIHLQDNSSRSHNPLTNCSLVQQQGKKTLNPPSLLPFRLASNRTPQKWHDSDISLGDLPLPPRHGFPLRSVILHNNITTKTTLPLTQSH